MKKKQHNKLSHKNLLLDHQYLWRMVMKWNHTILSYMYVHVQRYTENGTIMHVQKGYLPQHVSTYTYMQNIAYI